MTLIHFTGLRFFNIKILDQNCQFDSFCKSKLVKIDFTENLSNRKILRLPHCELGTKQKQNNNGTKQQQTSLNSFRSKNECAISVALSLRGIRLFFRKTRKNNLALNF